jgi:hypothetical protein
MYYLLLVLGARPWLVLLITVMLYQPMPFLAGTHIAQQVGKNLHHAKIYPAPMQGHHKSLHPCKMKSCTHAGYIVTTHTETCTPAKINPAPMQDIVTNT